MASPATASSAPGGSILASRGSDELGTSHRPAIRAARAIGTLMRNVDAHENRSSRSPDSTVPIAPPRPAKPAQMLIAFRRSVGSWKTLVRMERVPGMMNAAPTPMAARAAMRCQVSDPNDATKAERANTTSPPWSAVLRPNRSAMAPAGSRRPANTRP